ncbi:MAG: hypothetical protein IH797_01635 [Chloroflexi bacterium]|nr:hypothetical protein [Chloroflexota bacterium]
MISVTVNGKPRELDSPLSVTAFLKTLDINARQVAVAIGGVVFMRFVLMPAAPQTLDQEQHAALREKLIARWKIVVMVCITLLLLSGIYNMFAIAIPKGRDVGPVYHALFGVKVLAQLGAFTFFALLPTFFREWDLSHSQAGVLNGIIFGAYALSVPFIVPLTDRIDPRRIYICAVGLTTCSHLGMAFFAEHGGGGAHENQRGFRWTPPGQVAEEGAVRYRRGRYIPPFPPPNAQWKRSPHPV